MPIEPKDAVKKAYEYLSQVMTNPEKMSNVRVEELEQDATENWHITLSYDIVGDFLFERKREYKDFLIDKDTGRVTSMKIRTL